MTDPTQRFKILDIRVDAVTPESATSVIEEHITERLKGTIVFLTVSSILAARENDHLRAVIDRALLVTPDGMPLVWLGRRQVDAKHVARVYGPDFMLSFFESTGGKYKHFFFGGGEGVAEIMTQRLTERFPHLRVVGVLTPPASFAADNTDPRYAEAINKADPDVVWVGLGHPKQELWADANTELLNASVIASVGAAFDFHSGVKREAPDWMKRAGLQWLHRLVREPRRLWRRYLIGNSLFVLLLVKERLREAGGIRKAEDRS